MSQTIEELKAIISDMKADNLKLHNEKLHLAKIVSELQNEISKMKDIIGREDVKV